MAKDCEKVEQMMQEKDCTGKRVTKELIESHIDSVDYQTVEIAGHKFMYCGIKMDNKFVAVGKPATCVDPTNWRDEIGQKISYDNSFEELWKLEAYRMMSAQPVSLTLTEGQIKALAELAGMEVISGDCFDENTPYTIQDGHVYGDDDEVYKGLFAYSTDYPEEGVITLENDRDE